jgi:hypothetical protein
VDQSLFALALGCAGLWVAWLVLEKLGWFGWGWNVNWSGAIFLWEIIKYGLPCVFAWGVISIAAPSHVPEDDE